MESTSEVLTMMVLAVAFFAALVLIIFILAKYSHLTKKVLAETGQQPGSTANNKFIYQDIACIVIGLGVGLGFSSIITELNLSEDTTDLLVYSIISIFSGLGLLVAQMLRKRSKTE